MSADLKHFISGHFQPSRQAADLFFEEIRQEAHAPMGYKTQTQMGFNNVLPKIFAEVELFCASYAIMVADKSRSGGTTIGHFHGILGDVTNSQVTLYDFGAIYQILKDRGIPREARIEFEDIVDGLKKSPPHEKASFFGRGEKWIHNHKGTLGAGAEIILKSLRAWFENSPK